MVNIVFDSFLSYIYDFPLYFVAKVKVKKEEEICMK